VSKPGRLPCKAIIHAVGPIWSSGHMNEKNLLYETVFNVLEEAESQRFTTVALPAISSGLYRFPLQLATNIILDAVKNFLKQSMPSQNVCEVHIIDQSVDVISQFCKTATDVFEDVDKAEVVHVSTSDGPSNKVAGRLSAQTSRTKPGESVLCLQLNITSLLEVRLVNLAASHSTAIRMYMWVWFLAAYRRTHSPGRLAWSEGRRPLGAVPYSSREPGELSQWL